MRNFYPVFLDLRDRLECLTMASASVSSKTAADTTSVAADKEESASDKESERDQSQNTDSNESHQNGRSKLVDLMFPEQVYKRLSRINGAINRMSKSELLKKVHDLQLDSRGNKEVLKKRLKMFYKKHRLRAVNSSLVKETAFEFLLVIDFEATCTPYNFNFKHEIIEFPIILVDVKQKKIVDKFHAYCKPTMNPQLTKFCIELTGITQETVDNAPIFPVVMSQALQWLVSKGLLTSTTNSSHRKKKFAIVTDGPWDMGRFLYHQCQYCGVQFPRWARRWINIRRRYESFYNCKKVFGLKGMLEMMGMSFEGQLHCGLDDAYNIARIALRLMADGCCLKVNEYLNAPIEDVSSSSTAVSTSAAQSNSEDSDSSDDDAKGKLKSIKISARKTLAPTDSEDSEVVKEMGKLSVD